MFNPVFIYTKSHFFVHIIFICIFSSCQSLPQLLQSFEDIETQEAINITVDKEALNQNTDLQINVIVKNKEKK